MIKIAYLYEITTLSLQVDGERIRLSKIEEFGASLAGSFGINVPKRLRGSFSPGQQVYVTISTEKPAEGVEMPEGEQNDKT